MEDPEKEKDSLPEGYFARDIYYDAWVQHRFGWLSPVTERLNRWNRKRLANKAIGKIHRDFQPQIKKAIADADKALLDHVLRKRQRLLMKQYTQIHALEDSRVLSAARRHYIVLPEGITFAGPSLSFNGPEDKVFQFKRAVAEAERKIWDHRRGWISIWLALLFGLAGATSTVYIAVGLRPKIDVLAERVRQLELRNPPKNGSAGVAKPTDGAERK